MAIRACSWLRKSTAVCRTVSNVPPGGVTLKPIPGAARSITTMCMVTGRGHISVLVMYVMPGKGASLTPSACTSLAQTTNAAVRASMQNSGADCGVCGLGEARASGSGQRCAFPQHHLHHKDRDVSPSCHHAHRRD